MATILTDSQLRAARPFPADHPKFGKARKLPKEQGLYLLVSPNGNRAWRHSFRVNGRETTMSYGAYPEVSLAEARDLRDETRRKLRQGINPVAEKRLQKVAQTNTFEAIAREWLEAGCPPNRNNRPIDEATMTQLTKRLEKYLFPYHGNIPIRDVGVQDLHQTLRRITSRGKNETAKRVRSVASRVFRFAVATGRAERDPAADLKDALPSVATQSFATITDPKQIGKLLNAIDGYDGQPSVMAALRVLPYLFVRPGELRNAVWSEFDLDAGEWLIPAGRMKMSRDHWVPLSSQAVEIFRDLHRITGRWELVFPGIRSRKRPISENTLNAALRRLGYTSDQMTSHGFRSMASTRLNELRYEPDVIEAQLAHVDRNSVRRIYNRAQYENKRRAMMQAWADYLDDLKAEQSNKLTAIGTPSAGACSSA